MAATKTPKLTKKEWAVLKRFRDLIAWCPTEADEATVKRLAQKGMIKLVVLNFYTYHITNEGIQVADGRAKL